MLLRTSSVDANSQEWMKHNLKSISILTPSERLKCFRQEAKTWSLEVLIKTSGQEGKLLVALGVMSISEPHMRKKTFHI